MGPSRWLEGPADLTLLRRSLGLSTGDSASSEFRIGARISCIRWLSKAPAKDEEEEGDGANWLRQTAVGGSPCLPRRGNASHGEPGIP